MNIAYTKPSFDERELEAVKRVLSSDHVPGTDSRAFEQEFANYIGEMTDDGLAWVYRPYCIFTNSCTSALKLAYKYLYQRVLEDKEYFEGITYPANTFCATYSAASEFGIDYLPRYEPLDHHLTDDVKDYARVNMHYGSCKDETPCFIEDSAHRIEPNDPLIGKIRCYSFHEGKNMACGRGSSGGMLVTNDKEIYEQCRLWANDGRTNTTAEGSRYEAGYAVTAMAGGYDGHDLAASIGRVQLTKLPAFGARRRVIRDGYNAAFGQDWAGTHLYPYVCHSVAELRDFRAFLLAKGIQTSYHYPNQDGSYRSDWLAASLPIYPELSDNEINYIIETVREFHHHGSS